MGEFRTTVAALGAALTALGVGLVILAEPALAEHDDRLAALGWVLVAAGLALLGLALAGAIVAMARRRHRIHGLAAQMAAGIEVRQKIADEKPDDATIDALVNGWLGELQDYLRERDHHHRLIDVQS